MKRNLELPSQQKHEYIERGNVLYPFIASGNYVSIVTSYFPL